MNLELQITFRELITDIPKINPQNLICSLYMKHEKQFTFLSNITINTSHCLKDLTQIQTQLLQLRFAHNKTFLGCISLPLNEILSLSPVDFSQWLTIFEDIQDDLFDGELGENDEDIPKVLMNFALRQQSPPDKLQKTRSDIRETYSVERDKSPASILKNPVSNNSFSKIEDKRNRGVSFARDVLKKENDTSIQEILMISDEPLKKKTANSTVQKSHSNSNNINMNFLNPEDLLKMMNEKCNEVLKKQDSNNSDKKTIKEKKKNLSEVKKTEKNEKNEKLEKNEKIEKIEKLKEKIDKNFERKKNEKLEKKEIRSDEKIREKIEKPEKFSEKKPLIKSDEKIAFEISSLPEKPIQLEKVQNQLPSEPVQKKEKKKKSQDNHSKNSVVLELNEDDLEGDKRRILDLEKDISCWKLEFQEKIRNIDMLKDNVRRLESYESRYNELLKKFEEVVKENQEQYQDLLNKKIDTEKELNKVKSQTPSIIKKKGSRDKQNLPTENENKSSNEVLLSLVEDLKQKNILLSNAVKEENEKREKAFNKLDETIKKYQEMVYECQQIQEKSHLRDEEQAENIRNLNNLLVQQSQKNILLETSNNLLLKEKEELLMEKNGLTKNFLKANEHNKILIKELNDEKTKKMEEIRNLTEIQNEKQLEINRLQDEVEAHNRNLELMAMEVDKFKEFDLLGELAKKSQLLEENEKKFNLLQEKLMSLQRFSNNGKTSGNDDQLFEEINKKNEKIFELEKLIAENGNKNNERQFSILLESLRKENEELKIWISKKDQDLDRSHKKQFELSEEISLINIKLTAQNLLIQKLSLELKKTENPLSISKKMLINQNSSYSAQKNNEIDVNLMLYLQDNPIPIKISRISDGKYLYGSLKIDIFLENSKLLVSHNNEKTTLDDFNKNHLFGELNEIINQYYSRNNEELINNLAEISQGGEVKDGTKIKIKENFPKGSSQKPIKSSPNKQKEQGIDPFSNKKKK